MWYVVRVAVGKEDKMQEKMLKALSRFENVELFVPRYVRVRKYGGEWHTDYAVLFPGYIFVDARPEQAESIQKALCIFTGFVEPVCIGGGFYPIRQAEQELLQNVMDSTHRIGFSVGNIVDGELVVEKGPLANLAKNVCKIDRHGRYAIVKMMLWGEEYKVKVGLEVKEKQVLGK